MGMVFQSGALFDSMSVGENVAFVLDEFMKLKPPPQLSEDSDECPYHFGYLSERSKGEDIPEKCMTCKRLVQCMFK